MSECVNMVGSHTAHEIEKDKEKNTLRQEWIGIAHSCANSCFLKCEPMHRYGCMSVYVYMTMYVCVFVFFHSPGYWKGQEINIAQ